MESQKYIYEFILPKIMKSPYGDNFKKLLTIKGPIKFIQLEEEEVSKDRWQVYLRITPEEKEPFLYHYMELSPLKVLKDGPYPLNRMN